MIPGHPYFSPYEDLKLRRPCRGRGLPSPALFVCCAMFPKKSQSLARILYRDLQHPW
jgi:hypothetical protein